MPTFDLYEYVGYIVPGSILLICLMPFCPWIRDQFNKGTFTQVGIFLIVSFLFGHFLHAVAHEIERWHGGFCEGGVYGENIVVTNPDNQPLLTSAELTQLHLRILQMGIDLPKKIAPNNRQDFLTWCNATLRMEDVVTSAKRGALLGTFIKDYGLYLTLTTAFALVFGLCIAVGTFSTLRLMFGDVRPPSKREQVERYVRYAGNLVPIAFFGGYLAGCRLLYFGRLFSRELFLSFLAVDPAALCSKLAPG